MNKKKLFISLSLIFLLSAPSIFAETGNTFQQTVADIPAGTAEEYFNRGNFFRKQGDLAQAISDYTNAIRVNSNYAKAYYNRGNVYVKQGNLAQAISDYTKAVEINPDYSEAYYNRGNTYEKQGNLAQAVSDYSSAIKINPKYAAAYCNRGNAYQTQGNLQQALSDYNKAIEINPDFAGFYANRGNVYQSQNNLRKAIADYNKAIEINPDFAGFYTNRGNVYQSQGNLQQAINDYSKALEKTPSDNTSLYNRALAYYGVEQYGKSLEDYTLAIRHNPSKEAYENFIKNVPEKKASDTKNVRNEILLTFEERINPEKKLAMTAAPAVTETTTVNAPIIASSEPVTTAPAIIETASATATVSAPVITASVAPENQAQGNNKQTETTTLEEDVRNLVIKWVASWESGDLESYRNCYASDFQSKGMNLNNWIKYKNKILQKSKNISIRIDGLQISADENNAIAKFTQTYSSSILKDKGTKTLELKKIGNKWKIYREIM
ncbi:MAG: hypothetical protein APR62_13900 [Smithella sp. SDB]|nr:MAG: hypothetical protein APR62_13900 [Smithella sp. SDB]